MTAENDDPVDTILGGAARANDPRTHAAWTAWLSALARDADAAFAAAMAYGSLDEAARDTWLDALEEDAAAIDVPKIAVYAPLLSVEQDPTRLARMHLAIDDDATSLEPSVEPRALRGVLADGSRVVVVVLPLYLSFVQVFACSYGETEGFTWARHDPFCRDDEAPRGGAPFEGAQLERTPMKPVVEELAHAVLAQKRRGLEPPAELRAIVHLFTPALHGEEE